MQTHAIAWFEIPVTDFERARSFYNAILAFQMPDMQMGPNRMGFLPHQQGAGVGGAIVLGSAQGTLAYLTAGDDLAVVLGRVGAAGGQVVVPKTAIAPDMGFYAVFQDTEGNRVGLHSMN
jgi:predicted enzyme related to lactoylglutathione lyase